MSAAGATDQQQQANNAGSATAASSTREAILQAARQRFLHYGYKKTTIDEIAQDAGIGKGTVYLHFAGKDEIMLTLVLGVKRNITEQMRAIAASLAAPEDRLRRMVLACIGSVYDACTASPHGTEMVDEILFQMRTRVEYQDHFARETETQHEVLAAVLAEGARTGRFDVLDPRRSARLMMTAFAAFFPPYRCPATPGSGPRSRAELEAGVNELFDLLLASLLRRHVNA